MDGTSVNKGRGDFFIFFNDWACVAMVYAHANHFKNMADFDALNRADCKWLR